MTEEVCVLERRGDIAFLTLNRPRAANALSRELVARLGEHLQRVALDRQIRCLVLTGAGERVFCAGADLKERAGMSPPEVRAFLAAARRLLATLAALRCPSIAAINGAAMGGGLELALACDLRVALEGAELGLTETSLAIIPGAGGTQRLPRLVGAARAKELIFTARRVSAAQALAWGLVNQVVPGDLLERARELAEEIARNGPVAVAAAKRAIDGGLELSLDKGLDLEQACYADTLDTEDRLEALRAFKEKRPPVFQGR